MSTTADALPDDTEQDTSGKTWVTHPCVETGRTAIGFGIVNGPRGDLPASHSFLQVEELDWTDSGSPTIQCGIRIV